MRSPERGDGKPKSDTFVIVDSNHENEDDNSAA